jgi:septum formation topological specificity factor MinE
MGWLMPKRSASRAKERLQLVLIHDRTDITPAELDALRSQRLVADIPLRSVTRRRAE